MPHRPARLLHTLAFLTLALSARCAFAANAAADAKTILVESGISAGFFVHLSVDDGSLTSALKQNDAVQVHGLERDAAKVQIARKQLHQSGVYGEVSVVHFDDDELPYVDNLVNLFVTENLGGVSMDEVLRVLVPNWRGDGQSRRRHVAKNRQTATRQHRRVVSLSARCQRKFRRSRRCRWATTAFAVGRKSALGAAS